MLLNQKKMVKQGSTFLKGEGKKQSIKYCILVMYQDGIQIIIEIDIFLNCNGLKYLCVKHIHRKT